MIEAAFHHFQNIVDLTPKVAIAANPHFIWEKVKICSSLFSFNEVFGELLVWWSLPRLKLRLLTTTIDKVAVLKRASLPLLLEARKS